MEKYPDLKALRILHYPDPRLREHTAEIAEISRFLDEMAARMAELTQEAEGIGLAATQVGWPYRFVIVNTAGRPGEFEAFVNPVIIARSGKVIEEEGCLSMPGVFSKLRRAARVRVRAALPDGEEIEMEAEGLLARAWQHELDHLDGTLFVDRLGPARKIMIRNQLRDLERAYEESAPTDGEADEED